MILPILLLAAAKAHAAPVDKIEAMIPMRDGVHLHTEIFRLKKARGPLPFLIVRTPYGSGYHPFVTDPYIFVSQDIRGRYKSEGQFVMLRPPRDKRDPKAIDESTDTYDTIEWLLKNVPRNNGRAGVMGISYPGWLTVMAMLDPHPALKAVSEQASPADMFLGDDFHHNGAFRLSYGFEYVAMMETSKENFHFDFDRHDTFEWYLGLGPLAEANERYFHGGRPTWNAFVEHPNYDAYWQKQAVTPYLEHPTVPNLNVAGWWDQGGFLRPGEDLRNAGAARHRAYELPGGGAMEPRRLVEAGEEPGRDRVRRRYQPVLSRQSVGTVVRLLAQRARKRADRRGADIPDRHERMGRLRLMAAEGGESAPALLPCRRTAQLRSTRGSGRRRHVCLGSGTPGAVSASADPGDV